MHVIAQGIILFISGICAIIGCLFIIHVAARITGRGQAIMLEQVMTGLFVGWFFLVTSWVFAYFGGIF